MKKNAASKPQLLLLTVLLLVAACGRRHAVSVPDRILVFVTIPPQKYVVEKIGGPECAVSVLIPPGASPHSYEPKPAQMAKLAKARLYFSTGVEVEHVWLPRIRAVNPDLDVVATDSGIEKMHGTCDDHAHAESGSAESVEHHDEEAGVDPHIWLSPQLVKLQARSIAAALSRYDTAHAAVFGERLAAFERECDSLHTAIAARLSACGANPNFLVFHPSWGYFAREFSLRQMAIEVEGKEPGIRELGAIVKQARESDVGAVLIQPQFSGTLAATIAREMGVPTEIIDPLAEDWAENLGRVTGVLCGK
jgi:zinc transport system substrate-binding protein